MKASKAYQPPLFEVPIPLANQVEKVEWSYSRRSTLNQCARKYYFEYYGSNKYTAVREPLKEQLHFLKQFQNRYERTGFILHLMISQYFKKAQKGETSSIENFQSWATGIFRKDIQYSRINQSTASKPDGEYPPVMLTEFYLGVQAAEELCSAASSRMEEGLIGFFRNPSIAQFRSRGINPGALVEQSIRLPELPCRIDGKADLVYIADGKVNVIDWKSGEYDGSGDESLQLAVYALWAKEHFNYSPDQIHVYKTFVSTGDVVEFPIDEQLFAATRSRIIQDAEQMAELVKYGEEGIMEAFSPCGHSRVCELCPYFKICYGGE